MAQLKFGSAGVSTTEIDLSQPTSQQPVGVPAGIIGTALKGPAFVPITVGVIDDFYAKFGLTDGKKFGPIAVSEWLRNAGAVTYLRVLGVGDGTTRQTNGDVNSAGFTVGEQQPNATNAGSLGSNPYSNVGGALGRTYFLGAFMAETSGSTLFSQAGINADVAAFTAAPIVRGVLMATSGVILTLSSSVSGVNSAPASNTAVATDAVGSPLGDVVLMTSGIARQDFVLLINGLTNTNPLFPNVITASFDMTAPNYFGNVLNTNPLNLSQAGYCLYAGWDIHPSTAVVTGSGIVSTKYGAGAATVFAAGIEPSAFLLTSSLARDTGNSQVPDYEDFRDRFSHARSSWVVSQPFGGQPHNLFRVHALDDGHYASTLYKLSIENLAYSSDPTNLYGSFDLVLRQWGDNDLAPTYIEQWRGLSLNPSDSRYIAQVIGDMNAYFDFDRGPTAQKLVINGNYPNASNYVRIEMDANVDAGEVDPTALPVGIRGARHLITAGSGTLAAPTNRIVSGSNNELLISSTVAFASTVEPPVPMRQNLTQGSGAKLQVQPLLYWGVQFEHVPAVATPNATSQPNNSLKSFAKFFPEMRTDIQNFRVGDNPGAVTSAGAVVDADKFNLNMFTLMNVQVVTNSAGTADPNQWVNATYVRNGNIVTNNVAATRALLTTDFIQANRRFLKWSFFMQGGFSGVNIFDNDEATLSNAAV